MGCLHGPGKDYVHGEATKGLLEAQRLNPDAPAPGTPPPDGMPGAIANKVYQQRYVDSLTREIRDRDDSSDGSEDRSNGR